MSSKFTSNTLRFSYKNLVQKSIYLVLGLVLISIFIMMILHLDWYSLIIEKQYRGIRESNDTRSIYFIPQAPLAKAKIKTLQKSLRQIYGSNFSLYQMLDFYKHLLDVKYVGYVYHVSFKPGITYKLNNYTPKTIGFGGKGYFAGSMYQEGFLNLVSLPKQEFARIKIGEADFKSFTLRQDLDEDQITMSELNNPAQVLAALHFLLNSPIIK